MSTLPVDHLSDDSLPPRFGERYSILQKLGEGGVATVYKVLDRRERVEKALKALKPNYIDDPRAVERFEQEFSILRSLHHPSLPRMFEYGISERGHRCIVMEYIEGVPLRRYFVDNTEDLWLLMFEIAEALEFIHEHKLLHLDLKPENILVRRTDAFGGEKPLITLIDFGLAYRRESGGTVKVVGTPAYMAPEIISGAGRVTRAVDYYSFGVALYELLEGKVPYRGGLEDVLRSHLTKTPEFSGEQVEYAELYQHIRGLMSKEPRARLEAFEDFRRSLAARMGGSLEALNRAYAMGYIDSLAFIGKKDLLVRLQGWARRGAAGLQERAVEMQTSGEPAGVSVHARKRGPSRHPSKSGKSDLVDSALLAGKSGEIEEKIRTDLLGAARKETGPGPGAAGEGAIQDVPRVLLLSGPAGSGKSHLIDALRGECLLRGMSVFVLGEGGDYDLLVAGADGPRPGAPPADARSLIIDRFVRGWDRLQSAGTRGGAVLVMDGVGNVSQEEREFLDYVGKRIELMTDERREPGVSVVVSGRTARLKRDMAGTLPRGEQAEECVIPTPSHEDVEHILTEFHGHMAGIDDRKRLGDYLLDHAESYGALIGALRSALVKRELIREGGRWRFAAGLVSMDHRADAQQEYYRGLLSELTEEERDAVAWLCSHKGIIRMRDFEGISGIREGTLNRVLESISPYRVIDVREAAAETTLAIISERVRDSLYQELDKGERARFHTEYLRFYGAQPEDAGVYEAMTFHYEGIGDHRMSLIARIRALARLKRERDIFAMRRICSDGIRAAQGIRSKRWKIRKWHIERYFIKQWLEAEWMVSNYNGVIEVTRKYLYKKSRPLPLSFVYVYGMALRSVGEFKECTALIKESKKRIKKRKSEQYAKVLLLEAALLNNIGRFEESVKILSAIERMGSISAPVLCKIYVYSMLNNYEMGHYDVSNRYIDKVIALATSLALYDELYFAVYYRIFSLFNCTMYSKAKLDLRSSIKHTNQLRLYFRLCNMYHLLSGVYFEEGDYDRALKYLGKTQSVATNLGMDNWVNNCHLRYSYIYEKQGRYKRSVRFAEIASNIPTQKAWKGTRFLSMVQLLSLSVILNSEKAALYKSRLDSYPKSSISQLGMGYYYFSYGQYDLNNAEYDDAYGSFDRAFRIFVSTNLKDDAARSLIRMAGILLETHQYDRFREINIILSERMKGIESIHIKTEYLLLMLSYYYLKRHDRRRLAYYKTQCESSLGQVNDIELQLALSSLLCRANLRLGNLANARKQHAYYYGRIKRISNELDSAEIANMQQYSRLIDLTRELQIALKKRKNDQDE